MTENHNQLLYTNFIKNGITTFGSVHIKCLWLAIKSEDVEDQHLARHGEVSTSHILSYNMPNESTYSGKH